MRLRAWIAGFRWLHQKARRESLSAEEAEAYREAREDMIAMLLAAQRLALTPGELARGALRVVRPLAVSLQLPAGAVRAEALDISTGGFSADLSPPDAERMGSEVLDAALEQLATIVEHA